MSQEGKRTDATLGELGGTVNVHIDRRRPPSYFVQAIPGYGGCAVIETFPWAPFLRLEVLTFSAH